MKVKLLSCVRLFAFPCTVTYRAPWSMGFSRQEYWSGLPFPSPGDLPNPGIEPGSPALQTDALPSEPLGKHVLSPLDKVPWVAWLNSLYKSFSLSSFLCLLSALGRNQKFHIFHFVFRFINFIINSLSIKHCHLFILHSSSEEIRPVLRTFSHFGFFLLFLLFFYLAVLGLSGSLRTFIIFVAAHGSSVVACKLLVMACGI